MANSMMFRCRLSRRVCAASGADIVARAYGFLVTPRLLSSTPFRGLSGEFQHMPVILTTKARTRISIQVAVVLSCLGAGSAFAPLAAFEIPQERSAATYLGALTERNNYHVATRVRSDGNMLIFVVDTKYGKFQV